MHTSNSLPYIIAKSKGVTVDTIHRKIYTLKVLSQITIKVLIHYRIIKQTPDTFQSRLRTEFKKAYGGPLLP